MVKTWRSLSDYDFHTRKKMIHLIWFYDNVKQKPIHFDCLHRQTLVNLMADENLQFWSQVGLHKLTTTFIFIWVFSCAFQQFFMLNWCYSNSLHWILKQEFWQTVSLLSCPWEKKKRKEKICGGCLTELLLRALFWTVFVQHINKPNWVV